jgi:hypothetical protein
MWSERGAIKSCGRIANELDQTTYWALKAELLAPAGWRLAGLEPAHPLEECIESSEEESSEEENSSSCFGSGARLGQRKGARPHRGSSATKLPTGPQRPSCRRQPAGVSRASNPRIRSRNASCLPSGHRQPICTTIRHSAWSFSILACSKACKQQAFSREVHVAMAAAPSLGSG